MPDRDPPEFWDVAVLHKMEPFNPNRSPDVCNLAADIIRHYALRYDFRWNETRRQEYVRLYFGEHGVGYFAPKELRGLPPKEKFNLVMRELTPAVIQLLERS